ncbi:MAG: hypothetical protein IJN83_04330, partial [Clostridia bacterium]|nr:hypothetical protein [Clostridia bacterium]
VSRRFDTDFEPMEGGYSAIVADAETVQKYYAVMADREPWLELRDTPYTSDFAADAFCDIAVTSWRGEPVLAVAQYIAGPGGIHADRLGYFVSLIKWDDKGGYEVVDEFFASQRFALLSGDAKDADLINPDPIDTLSDMDLLTYAALEQGNGTYALPRTLSGNDLATEIWDRIMINVNNQYFSSMPYDAAGAAYNVVAVTQDANSGIIDVYTILTYRRYTLLNDELSVDGELNCAVIWQYKENENGEIEFSNVYWPLKDSKGRVSYGNREWPEDLQKYTDFSPDSIGRAERLKAIDEQIAISMDNTTNVGSLLGIITSSPKGSSAPIDYIHEHVGEYGQLCAMGQRAVSRFLPRFEKGYETGLEGQIMAAVLNALLGVDSLNDYENGQAWYDASRNGILAYMRLPDEKAALREAILRLYPLADEIAAKGFEAKVDAAFYEKTEALAQTMGLGLIGAGKSGNKNQPGCTIEIPDANCSMELCNMYAAVMFAAVPNLNEVTVGNTDYFNYNYHRTEGWELLLPAVVGDNISREEAEAYWSGLTKPILEEYGTSGSGIRELLRELANLSGIDLASAGLAQETPLHVSLLQPTPVPTPTPAPATGEHAWRAGKLAIEPYRDNDTSLLELSHYGITLSGNGTEQTESMRESKVSNDVYSRDGQDLLEVMRVPRGTLKLDVDLIQHSAESVKWNPDSETYGAVEYTPTWLP